jgi:DNA-binding transcriptional MerR regulator
MTGLPVDTLRAWERRHRSVTPARDVRGRMYSTADVERLRLLRDAVANGHAIGRIARLDESALRHLATVDPSFAVAAPARPQTSTIASAIAAALEDLNLSQVDIQLARAAALLTPIDLLREVVMPAMREVGEHWHTRPLAISHEHLLSGAVRNLLGSMMRVHARSNAPGRLLFATPAGERHEFGTLGGALIATSGGLGATYLGPDLPGMDIVEMATLTRSDVVVLGVTLQQDDGDQCLAEVRAIAARLPPRIELWLGGPAAAQVSAALGERVVAIADYDGLQAQLTRVGATF